MIQENSKRCYIKIPCFFELLSPNDDVSFPNPPNANFLRISSLLLRGFCCSAWPKGLLREDFPPEAVSLCK